MPRDHKTREENRLSRRVLAMVAVIAVARQQGNPPEPADGALIADVVTGNRRGLEAIFKQLVGAKILVGVRGARGGYLLARPAGEITLCDVDRAIDPLEIEVPPELAHAVGSAVQAYRRALSQWSIDAVNARRPAVPNPHLGSSLEEFLEAEGILDEVTADAINANDAYSSETD